jgi:predicted transcriptional regulator
MCLWYISSTPAKQKKAAAIKQKVKTMPKMEEKNSRCTGASALLRPHMVSSLMRYMTTTQPNSITLLATVVNRLLQRFDSDMSRAN